MGHTDPTERGDKVHRKMTFPLSSIMVFALVVMSKGQPNAQYSTYGDYSNYGGYSPYNRNLASSDIGGGRADPYAGYQASGLLAPAEAEDFGLRNCPCYAKCPPWGTRGWRACTRKCAKACDDDYSRNVPVDGRVPIGNGGARSVSVCDRRPGVVGPCKARVPRWTFSEYGGCYPFTYGGCHTNGNNFNSKAECEYRCRPNLTCRQRPRVVGPCKARVPRWTFSGQLSGVCYRFTYGGCGGNGNNFKSKWECERKCKY